MAKEVRPLRPPWIRHCIFILLIVSNFVIFTDDLFPQHDTYYLLEDGTDVSTCGRTAETACKSLEFILNLYYKDSSSPDTGLEIITSESLIIDQQLMVSLSREFPIFHLLEVFEDKIRQFKVNLLK